METKATLRNSTECGCVPYKPSVRALGLDVEGVGFDWLFRVHDLISKDTWGPGMRLAP